MNKKFFLGWLLCFSGMTLQAETITVNQIRHAGPYVLQIPFLTDSTNVKGEKFTPETFLDDMFSFAPLQTVSEWTSVNSIKPSGQYALHLASFSVENHRFAKAKLHITGVKNYVAYLDGEICKGADISLTPATHEIIIKFLSAPNANEQLSIQIETEQDNVLSLNSSDKRMYTLSDVLYGKRATGVEISPDGRYFITRYVMNLKGGKKETSATLTDLSTNKTTLLHSSDIHWMPKTCSYYYTVNTAEGRNLIAVSPTSGDKKVLAKQLPKGSFRFAPTEDYLLYTIKQEGPAEEKEIYETLVPDDRQPGWRNRSILAKYDLTTGMMQPLTFGYKNVYASAISSDGKDIILMTSRQRLMQRPFDLMSVYKLNLATMRVDTLITDDGFISNCQFSPDNKQLLITGSGEAFRGIGLNIEPGQTSSMVDSQLFLFDIATKEVKALTREFNPSIISASWPAFDNNIYFSANNRDYISFYRLSPRSGKIEQLETGEDIISDFDIANLAPAMAYYGESAANANRVYSMNLKNGKYQVKDDLSRDILQGIELGKCENWNYVNSRGDTIYGRYYLPPHFDASKKYPLIVNYYGGCTPVERNFESRYPHHAYAALGYIVYVIQPSGAIGFGQKFSARHVNTWGKYVADDIIEGTKQFCKEHAFVNDKKIGCIGASYGGFMTQYLQTQTDIFAAAISHAGISDITSYWGEGYWGYSYSQIASANQYPWSHPEMYTQQSPLFNADKIHTPLLFLHGDADTNVPVGESIQMFTALKLLGRETAFVAVNGQDHHILDYSKRIKWQNTIFAWFAKWLQDDALWWNTLYPPKNL